MTTPKNAAKARLKAISQNRVRLEQALDDLEAEYTQAWEDYEAAGGSVEEYNHGSDVTTLRPYVIGVR